MTYEDAIEEAKVEPVSEDELHGRFDQMLDDTYSLPSIVGAVFTASQVIKQSDRIAYNEAFSNWIDELETDGELVQYAHEYYTRDDWNSVEWEIEQSKEEEVEET